MVKLTCLLFFLISITLANDGDLLRKKIILNGNWNVVRTLEFKVIGKQPTKWQGYSYPEKTIRGNDLYYFYSPDQNFLYHTSDLYSPGGYHFDFRFIMKNKKVYTYNPSGSRIGKTYTVRGEKLYNQIMGDVPHFMPYYMLKALKVEHISFLKNGDIVNKVGNDSIVITFSLNGLVDKTFTYTKSSDRYSVNHYTNYTFREGKWIPTKLLSYSNNKLRSEWSLENIQFNTMIEPSLKMVPKEFKKDEEKKRKLTLTKLSKKTYLLENINKTRNSLIYVLSDGLLINDAPISDAVSKKVASFLKKELNKKIKYVFLGHHHNDHIFGFTEYYKQGASIIFNRSFYQAIIDRLNATNQKIQNEMLIPFDNTLKLFNNSVSFHTVKNGTHAEGISFFHLPEQKIIYQGDFFTLPYDKFTIKPIQGTIEFDDYLKENMIDFKYIISHHAYSKIDKMLYEKIMGR